MSSSLMDLTEDIKPISDFRANAAALLKQVQESGRPLVLTQHGRSAAILVDVQSYQELIEELHTLREIAAARTDYATGNVTKHDDLMARLRDRRK
ncbi:MAG: type II toxin-antitoxin system Phd/YefM family antitoxin [Myxococcota bacterium]